MRGSLGAEAIRSPRDTHRVADLALLLVGQSFEVLT